MKTLFLLRHAKTEDISITGKDFDRKLKSSGIKDAIGVAKHLAEKKVCLDLIISSTAARTTETSEIFAEELKYPLSEIQFEKIIYSGDHTDLLFLLTEVNDRYNNVLLVGHNPVITNLYNTLADKFISSFKTSTVACIQFNIKHWNELIKEGELNFIINPCEL